MSRQCKVALMLLLIACFSLVIFPVSAAGTTVPQSGNDAVTRGSRFTITITGVPNTPYYVWITRTFTMTGEPGDQPPVIIGGQWNVAQDSPGGPYTIGSYAFNNGNGRTILDDVAPSTPEASNTRYYALVTTDSDGRAVVAFQTSSATAQKTFSVRYENPQYIDTGNTVAELGDMTVKRGSVSIDTVATTAAPAATPTTPALTPNPTLPTVTQTPPPSPSETPTNPAPLETGFCIVVAAMGALVLRKK